MLPGPQTVSVMHPRMGGVATIVVPVASDRPTGMEVWTVVTVARPPTPIHRRRGNGDVLQVASTQTTEAGDSFTRSREQAERFPAMVRARRAKHGG